MEGVSWSGCSRQTVRRIPTHDARRATHASMRVRRGSFGGVGFRRILLFALFVMMAGRAIPDLRLHRLHGDTRRMLEHHLAAQHARPHETHEADYAEEAGDGELLRRHLEA